MNVVISTHVYTTGPAQDLRDYLNEKKEDRLFFIGHPLFFDKKLKGSGFEKYQKGILKEEQYSRIKRLPVIYSYFKDIWLTLKWVMQTGQKWDLFVGSDNLNALSGIILKKFGRANKVIYYVIDYNPYRFENKVLNFIYHKIDQFCVRYADETWNLSPRMEWGRRKYFEFSGGNQKVVPVGVWTDRINLKVKKVPNALVFMGHVTKKQGIQNVIMAIPEIKKKIPDFKFIVIGGGDYLKHLQELSKELEVSRSVEFKGFIDDHKDIERILPKYSLAIAPYEKYDERGHLSFTYFADPAKLKLYLACGLPILISDVPYNASEIEIHKCGRIIGDGLANDIISLLKTASVLKSFQLHAQEYSKQFNWKTIFSNSLDVV
jgi:glycosyltransferase involved in cell wall biosynthesis